MVCNLYLVTKQGWNTKRAPVPVDTLCCGCTGGHINAIGAQHPAGGKRDFELRVFLRNRNCFVAENVDVYSLVLQRIQCCFALLFKVVAKGGARLIQPSQITFGHKVFGGLGPIGAAALHLRLNIVKIGGSPIREIRVNVICR